MNYRQAKKYVKKQILKYKDDIPFFDLDNWPFKIPVNKTVQLPIGCTYLARWNPGYTNTVIEYNFIGLNYYNIMPVNVKKKKYIDLSRWEWK